MWQFFRSDVEEVWMISSGSLDMAFDKMLVLFAT